MVLTLQDIDDEATDKQLNTTHNVALKIGMNEKIRRANGGD